MKSYTSLNKRWVSTLQGVSYNFEPGVPVMVQENTIAEVEAAGIPTTETYNALLAGQKQRPVAPQPVTVEEVAKAELEVAGEDENLEGEMASLAAEARARDKALQEALALEEAEAEKEKSPAFDQVVFEAAVREVLEGGNADHLTPTGKPKAKVISDLCGFDVAAIKITQYCKTLD